MLCLALSGWGWCCRLEPGCLAMLCLEYWYELVGVHVRLCIYSWGLVAVDTLWQLNFAATLILLFFFLESIPAESKLLAWCNGQMPRREKPGLWHDSRFPKVLCVEQSPLIISI